MSATLLMPSGGEIPVWGICAIGRSKSNTVVVDDPKVSRRHAVIQELAPREFWLFEFNNRNGTWLNGVRMQAPLALHDGDEIRVGGALLRFVSPVAKNANKKTSPPETFQQTTEGDAEQEAHVATGLFEATGHGVVALNRQFEVTAITEESRRWLGLYFPNTEADKKLPETLEAWVAARRKVVRGTASSGETCPPVFVKDRGENRLVVRMKLELNRDRCMLLLAEERPLFSVESLQLDFGREFAVTHRQAEVLFYLTMGKSNPVIAQILDVAEGTVVKHLENIYPKIDVSSRHEATRFVEDFYRQNRDV